MNYELILIYESVNKLNYFKFLYTNPDNTDVVNPDGKIGMSDIFFTHAFQSHKYHPPAQGYLSIG